MQWLNYHHLFYFWTVAREGSLARASLQLRLAPSTLSAQIGALERAIGEKLFARAGRALVPTDSGRLVLAYADQIFTLGRELVGALRGHAARRPLTVVIGVSDAVPKLIARRLIEPALALGTPVRVVCREGPPGRLLGDLAVHEVDVVLSDAPARPLTTVRAYYHLLGECGVTFFAAGPLASRHARGFPGSLDGAPLLLPRETAPLRAALQRWFDDRTLRPQIVGEFDDSALLKAFGEAGAGVFAGPSVIEDEIRRHYRVRVIGRTEEVRERFFAISLERKVSHPAVLAITQAARGRLFQRRGRG